MPLIRWLVRALPGTDRVPSRPGRPIRAVTVVAMAVALVAGGLAVGTVSAETSPRDRQEQIEREIAALREQVSEASAEESDLLTALGETRGRLAAIEAAVAEYDLRILDATSRLQAAEAVVADLDLRLGGVAARLAATEAEAAAVADRRTEAIVQLYMGAGSDPLVEFADFLLDADDANEILRAREYLRGTTIDATAYTDQLRALEEDLDVLRAELEDARRAAQDGRDAVDAERAGLEQLRSEQVALLDEARAEEQQELSLVAEARERQDDFEARIASLEAESASIAAYLRNLQAQAAAAGIVQSGSGQFQRPVPGPITSPYGYRRHPILGSTRLHTGADLRAAQGDRIVAAEDGLVVWAGWRGGYGNCVIIDHGGGLATLYAHQSALSVSQGDQVERGEAVGSVGSTGLSTGPHLHFEVRQLGTPVDPAPYL